MIQLKRHNFATPDKGMNLGNNNQWILEKMGKLNNINRKIRLTHLNSLINLSNTKSSRTFAVIYATIGGKPNLKMPLVTLSQLASVGKLSTAEN